MFRLFKKDNSLNKEPKNPEGLTYDEFIEKNKDIKNLAVLCWGLGCTTDELKEELKKLQMK